VYQSITLVGRLGRDAEARYTGDGTPVTTMSVVVDRRWKDASGKDFNKPTWFKITCWRKLAEIVGKYCRKGMIVLVVGEMQESKPYARKDGSYACNLEVTANTVRFLSKASEDGAAGEQLGEEPVNFAIKLDDAEEIPF